MERQKAKYGEAVELDEATQKAWYAIINKFTPGTEGITMEDMKASRPYSKALGAELFAK